MPDVRIFCIGVNHDTAPVAIRESLSCSTQDMQAIIATRCLDTCEWVWLSTCNRVELYLAVEESFPNPRQQLVALFEELAGLPGQLAAHHMYVHEDVEAANHLLRVAAGLDSLVLGEPQILGQVKTAYEQALQLEGPGPALKALFLAAITTGKRVRSETGISNNPASIPSVAINQAQALLGDLTEKSILVIGAGAMARVTIKALQARGIGRIAVANRTLERAADLVAPWSGEAYDLQALPAALAAADVVFSATYSPIPVVDRPLLSVVQDQRQQKPLLLFDLAIPRDIQPAVSEMPGVTLIDLDRLQAELDESLASRREAIPQVEAIIAEEDERLSARLGEVAIRPVIAGLRQKAESIRQRELARTMRYLGQLDQETFEHINHLTRALVNQLLHEPTTRLRKSAANGHSQEVATAVCTLFDLETPGEGDCP